MSSGAFNIGQILEKMTNRDKDFRFMATHDLANELEKETFKIDANAEPKVVTQLLKLLEDPANNVQENSVKCLGLLVKRVKEPQATEIVDTLCNHMLNEKKDDLREISNIGLKTVISQMTEGSAVSSSLVKRLTPRLINGVTGSEKPEVKMCCLDILNDLLQRFGNIMLPDIDKVQKIVLPHLTSGRPATRKRAINCLGQLAILIPDHLFSGLIDFIITSIEGSKKADDIRTLIQAIGAVSRSAGYRLGKYLPRLVPLIVIYSDSSKFENDDELRENCFQAFESLVLRCPKDIAPYLNEIINLSLKFIKYDPNYAAEDDEEDAESMETDEGDEEEEADEDEGDISDDDDMSWKVRRAATKCLSAIITTRPELLSELYQKVAPSLIARFLEREENVKMDVFATFVDLLKQTGVVSRRADATSGAQALLNDLTPKIVAGLNKQLNHKSVKTRVGAFSLLKELVTVRPGALSNHVAAIVPGVVLSLGDKGTNSNLKIEALTFLRLLLSTHSEAAFHPHVKALAAPVLKAVGDHYYRISAEGLRVLSELVRVIRPANGAQFDFKPYVNDIYQASLQQLKAQDIDQEVKEGAINCIGIIVATLGDSLPAAELNACLSLLLDRLRNEITRVNAVKAISRIAQSNLKIDISTILADVIKELSGFLRKSNRQLKQSSLTALDDVVRQYGSNKAASALFPSVFAEVAPLISDADLHLSHLALHLCVSILSVNAESAPLVVEKILPQTFTLLHSSLLQGLALESLLSLYSQLVSINAKGASYDQLLDSLLSLINKGSGANNNNKDASSSLNKQSFSSIAQCVAAVTAKAPDAKKRGDTVERFIKEINTSKDDAVRLLALLSLGEIGRRVDLSSHTSLHEVVLTAFESSSEETKQAASFALGNIAVGNLPHYLPIVLKEIKAQPKKQYLLLHSLREIIVREAATGSGAKTLQPYLTPILELLFENCESEEEGTRNVVSECLGKFALINPKEIIPLLQQRIKSPSAYARATVATALKFTILDHPVPIDELLLPKMGDFLDLLSDKELNVRRVTLLAFNYAAHNKPSLIRDILSRYMPVVYGEAKVKPELIREVDLGPFKHKVDDGLEIRKAAFECMYTLLDSCIDRLDLSAFIASIGEGLKDHYDIKMLCHLMLIRLATYAPAALLEGLTGLIEPLRTNVLSKLTEGAVKQQIERNDELIRSTLRAIAAIARIPNVESVPQFETFVQSTIMTPGQPLAEKYATIVQEEAATHADTMDVSS